jgi:ketol-acid reductoisomerase
MNAQGTTFYYNHSANPDFLKDHTVAVIGYGNQGRAQALNLRDSGIQVIVGNRDDEYRQRSLADGFRVFDISIAVEAGEIIMLLIPDESLPAVFETQIKPYLKAESALVFASGYSLAFDQIQVPPDVDALLIAPRMIGIGVRERYLTGEGFYCLVGVHQEASGCAQERLLALTWAIGGLNKPAIEVTCKQEAILDLFNEQAFGPAFGRALLTAISVLIDRGLPPEAVLVEMYLSEEMAYTYRKMAQVGLVKQTLYHSQTSQYGAMSRGVRFLGLGLDERMQAIYEEIDSGAFAREWASPLARLKFKVIRYFAMRQPINKLEAHVRKAMGLKEHDEYQPPADIDDLLKDPAIQAELESFEDAFEYSSD